MAYHVRPLGGAEAVFTDYDVALAAARMRADEGTQAALVEVGGDGGEVLHITCCRRLPPVDLADVQSSGQGRGPFAQRSGPVFVFVDPRNRS